MRRMHRMNLKHRKLSLHRRHPKHRVKAMHPTDSVHPTLSGHGKYRVKPPHSGRSENLSHRMTCMKGRHRMHRIHCTHRMHRKQCRQLPACSAPDACRARPAKETRRGSFSALCHPLALSGRLRPLSGFAFVRNIAPGTPFRYEVISGDCLR